MLQQATALDLNLTRIDAVDGAALTRDDTPNLSDDALLRWGMTSGEIACSLSHQRAWQQIANNDVAFAAVFEDDVIFSQEIKRFLVNHSWVPEDIDCIKLDLSSIHAFHQKPQPLGIAHYTISRPVSSLGSTGGYIISKDAAIRLLEQTRIIGGPIDNQMFAVNDPSYLGLDYRQINPAICAQAVFVSKPLANSDGIYGSTIQHGGISAKRRNMPFGWKKIWRELKRPFRKPFAKASAIVQAPYYWYSHEAKHMMIAFEDVPTKQK